MIIDVFFTLVLWLAEGGRGRGLGRKNANVPLGRDFFVTDWEGWGGGQGVSQSTIRRMRPKKNINGHDRISSLLLWKSIGIASEASEN